MSARCTGAVFARYPAGGGEFALALALADNAHDDGTHIFPGVDTMAKKSRQSVRAVQGHLRTMLANGWLELVNGGGGAGRKTEYRISAAWLNGADIAPFFGPVDNSKKGCKPRQKMVQNDAQKGAERRTPYITGLTIIEPIPPNPPVGGAPGFDEFFAGYPRQVDELIARQEWDKLAPDLALQAEIAKAVAAWRKSPDWQRDSGRYIPKPGKWLRLERWRDVLGVVELPGPAPAPVAPSRPAAPMPAEVRAKVDALLGRRSRKAVPA